MANYTVTTSMNLETAITNGSMVDGENLTINNGAVVTCDQSPSILMGQITINDGKLFIDGQNIASGNVINFVGEQTEEINVNAQGTLEVDGDWYTLGTTNGTDSQTFNTSTYWGATLEDVVPAIWVETGRRIDYDNASGNTPEVDDWLIKTSDEEVFGRIVEVNTTSSYIVVKFLTGTLANNDQIGVKKVVDRLGPSMELDWTADVNNASGDIKESGIYQEFGNARAVNSNYLGNMGHGVGGFAFDNAFQSTTLTMGTSSGTNGGFVPPSGCTVRVPNVHFSNATTTTYSSGNTNHAGSTATNWFELVTTNGGVVDLSICNVGTASFGCNKASAYTASYVGASIQIGSEETFAPVSYTNCVVCNDPVSTATNSTASFNTVQLIGSATITDCLIMNAGNTRSTMRIENCNNVTVNKCISSYGGGAPFGTPYCYFLNLSSGIKLQNCVAIGTSASNTTLVQMTTANDVEVTDFRGSVTQDYSTLSASMRHFYCQSGTRDVLIQGWTPIGSGFGNNALITFFNAYDFRIRAMGTIDDKIDLQAHTQSVFTVITTADNIDIARVWTKNASLFGGSPYQLFTLQQICNNISIKNSSADYGARINMNGKDKLLYTGVHSVSGAPGGNGGIEESLPGTYGRQIHDAFKADDRGVIWCSFVPESADIDNLTIDAGNPKFQKDGTVDVVSGDQWTIEQDYYSLGHSAFTGQFTALVGTGAYFNDEWANVDVDFQYDVGSGYNGSWLDARTVANWTAVSGTHEFDYDNESGGPFTVGETLSWGTGGTAGTGRLRTLTDNGATGTINMILLTGVAPTDGLTITGGTSSATADVNGAVDDTVSVAVDGVKLKYQFTATGTQTNMTMFIVDTTTTLDDQLNNLHPVDQNFVTVSVNVKDATSQANIENARVLLEAASGGDLAVGTDILSGTTNASGIIQDTAFLYTSDQPVSGKVRRATTGTLYKTLDITGTITESGLQINGFMIRDE